MRKLINDVKTISLDDLVAELENNSRLIVYYRSNNDRNGTPVFLKKMNIGWGFINPIHNYSTSYLATSIRACLKEAIPNRHIYILNANEGDKLFKLQI